MNKQSCVYIITNKINTVLYTGMTGNLFSRIIDHKEGNVEGFSKKYNLHKLVYYEVAENALSAIAREKYIKNMSRRKKEDRITSMNANRRDLFPDLSQ